MGKSKARRPRRPKKPSRGEGAFDYNPKPYPCQPWRKISLVCLLAVALLSLILSVIGIGYGRTGLVPWHPDSIEGITITREMPRLFKEWKYKYPRGQFLINAIFYKPLLDKWEKDPVPTGTGPNGQQRFSILNLARLDKLAMISRAISLAMGVGTVIAVFLCARLLFRDDLSAFIAGLTLSVTQLFIYYNHLSSVDIPHFFWFAWGLYWSVKSVYIGKWRHFVMMGLCFSMSICTKDVAVGFLVGMVPGFWLCMAGKVKADGEDLKKAFMAVFSKKILLAAIVFLFTYALLQDLLTSPGAYAGRMSHWLGGPGVTNFNKGFNWQIPLLWESCRMLYSSFGWPLLSLILVSVVWLAIKRPWLSAMLVLPLIVYYLVVVMKVKMVCPRYFILGYAGLAVCVGKCCADWLRWSKSYIPLRIVPLVVVFGLSLLYCIGTDIELLGDSRIETERWFAENVDKSVPVACYIRDLCRAPRLHSKGYRYLCPWKAPPLEAVKAGKGPLPEYLIILTPWMTGYDTERVALRKAVLAGETVYREVATFTGANCLWPDRTIFGFAGWPLKPAGSISPVTRVFVK